MKFLLFALALIGFVAADVPHLSGNRRAVLDSATQGPNPQDIATPEPEYIDIDLPEPPRPVPALRASLPTESLSGHVFTSSGYRYKRPLSYRRTHRFRH